jgi:hypothetical protein
VAAVSQFLRVIETAGVHESLINVATHNAFVILAEDVPRELVIGTVVIPLLDCEAKFPSSDLLSLTE